MSLATTAPVVGVSWKRVGTITLGIIIAGFLAPIIMGALPIPQPQTKAGAWALSIGSSMLVAFIILLVDELI